jgi:hypothetical protein
MTVAVGGMMISMRLKGFAGDYFLATFFFGSAAACTILLVRYLRA